MAELSKTQKQAVASGIATLVTLARNSLSPTQTKLATRSAGHLLWLMGMERYEAEGLTFVAIPPEGETIDIELSSCLLATAAEGRP